MFRVALGYDLHRLQYQENSKLVCGGIIIPCDYCVEGAHSDGDLVLHALTDALLSVVGSDIGIVFPNTDPENRDRASIHFLQYAYNAIKDKYRIVNVDVVIICDMPKIAPHIAAMKKKLAEILKIAESDISVRGKTTENTSINTITAFTNVLFQEKQER